MPTPYRQSRTQRLRCRVRTCPAVPPCGLGWSRGASIVHLCMPLLFGYWFVFRIGYECFQSLDFGLCGIDVVAPLLTLGYLLGIFSLSSFTTMSVPPVVAPRLKTTASPNAISSPPATPEMSGSLGIITESWVALALSISSRYIITDIPIVPNRVPNKNSLPIFINPTINSGTLISNTSKPTDTFSIPILSNSILLAAQLLLVVQLLQMMQQCKM